MFHFKFENVSFTKFPKKILMIKHVTINLKWRKCDKFFKPLNKQNMKYAESLNFYLFSLFHFILSNYILTRHIIAEKYFLIWYIPQSTAYADGWFLTKTSIIDLKKFTLDIINYLGWESNLSIRPPRFF